MEPDSNAPTCFVIMPYSVKDTDGTGYPSDHWSDVYQKLIRPGIENAGLQSIREDEDVGTKLIVQNILNHIEQAEIILCDLSSHNPNVLLELGWALRADKPVVLIKDELTENTFDLSQHYIFDYSSRLEAATLSQEANKLAETVANTLKDTHRRYSLVKRMGLSQDGAGDALCGISTFYSKRVSLTPAWWESFYDKDKNPKEVLLMGQSISKAFKNDRQAEAFAKWCNNGATVRILFLSPENAELSQLQNVGTGMVAPPTHHRAHPANEYLKWKIYETVDDIWERVIQHVPAVDRRPMVRFATRDLPFSIMAVDDDMVVTFYGTDPEADNQPTLLIHGTNGRAYQSFMQEFETIWSNHSKVSPYEDPIITDYRQSWRRYIHLRDYDSSVPPPRQAIIFPTYRCSTGCSYCMYSQARNGPDVPEMDPAHLDNILAQLFEFGVRHFEVSGGGEPLEHERADELISCLEAFQSTRNEGKLGMITNGIRIDEYGARLLDVFNDYIRVSRYGDLADDEATSIEATKWKAEVKLLLVEKRRKKSPAAKIGIKYLLTLENKDRFVKTVLDDLQDSDLRGVDHFRFRSDRRVDEVTVTRIEQQLYYILKEVGLSEPFERISLSLPNLVYPRNFRCWISPMNVVIAPDGDVYVCCNYMRDQNDKCLGNILDTPFAELWQSAKHKRLRQKLSRRHCNWEGYSNCRYAEIQSVFERIALTVGQTDSSSASY